VHLVAGDPDEDPVPKLLALNRELEAYDADLLDRPQLVVLSKSDLLQPDELALQLAALTKAAKGPAIAISSATGAGIPALVRAMWDAVRSRTAARATEAEG
jgi:GTP-binding protein